MMVEKTMSDENRVLERFNWLKTEQCGPKTEHPYGVAPVRVSDDDHKMCVMLMVDFSKRASAWGELLGRGANIIVACSGDSGSDYRTALAEIRRGFDAALATVSSAKYEDRLPAQG
jgi:hypothetical protein